MSTHVGHKKKCVALCGNILKEKLKISSIKKNNASQWNGKETIEEFKKKPETGSLRD